MSDRNAKIGGNVWSAEETPPPTSQWIQQGFHAFLGRYLRRHFHCIGLQGDGFDPSSVTDPLGEHVPTIVYANHPAWWDPLIAHYLNHLLFQRRQFYAPIDADALSRYRVFEKLGFYGINLKSTSGAAAFLKTSMSILRGQQTALWITPEGRFCDARDHGAALMPGLAHLCSKLSVADEHDSPQRRWRVIPMALEYAFWDERLPVCMVRFGQPFEAATCQGWGKPQWNLRLAERLRENQTALAQSVIARNPAAFKSLMVGKVGAGFLYDSMRRVKSWLNRERFRAEHGEHFR